VHKELARRTAWVRDTYPALLAASMAEARDDE
jgi:hypothetical protein